MRMLWMLPPLIGRLFFFPAEIIRGEIKKP